MTNTQEKVEKNTQEEEFNFQEPVRKADKTDSFSNYAEKKAKNIQSKINSRESGTNSIWLLVFVLIISFVALSVFSFIQIQEKNQEIARFERQEVAGVSEGSVKNIIAARDFSLVMDAETPENFNLEIKETGSPFLEDRKATQSSFVSIIEKGDEELISGIEVFSTQNEGQLTLEEFGEEAAKALGNDYKLSDNFIEIPNNRQLLRIDSNKIDGIFHYVGVTDDNYYVVKIYNQTTKDSSLLEYSRFVDMILASLYLN